MCAYKERDLSDTYKALRVPIGLDTVWNCVASARIVRLGKTKMQTMACHMLN